MKIITKFLIVLILLYSLSCKNENRIENLFLQYLKKTFNIYDVSKVEFIIIIPFSGCKGCNNEVYSIFINKFIDNNKFILIIGDPIHNGLLSPTLNAKNVKYDFLIKMSEYDFGYGYPSCFIFKNNKIINKIIITPELISLYKKLK